MEKRLHRPHDRNPRDDTRAVEPAHYAPRRDPARVRAKWVFLGFLAVSAFFLFAEHRAHLFGFLPWLILLLCPLMHIFMHGGHGHGGHGGHDHTSNSGDGKGEIK